MLSKEFRVSPTFLRNEYVGDGQLEIPIVKKQSINLDNLDLISYANVKINESEFNKKKGVHFFVDDYRFERIYDYPNRSLEKLSQYKFLCTPDYSLYAEMQGWRQVENVAKNRWLGAYWQEHSLCVIPTVSWSTPSSFRYCFKGVERNSIVAIGMIGCKRNKRGFMFGYDAMLEELAPEAVICLGEPFDEMRGNIIKVDYNKSRKGVHYGR